MKKYLFLAIALLGLAACAKDDLADGNKPIHSGEVEESYIAINLMAADNDTRAVTDDIGNADEYGYEEGTTAERAVKTAYFFFFDENGDPFKVTTSAPGGDKNHLSVAISEDSTSGMENVSDIKEAVLILNTYKGVYPSQIVAVINWVPTANTYSLEDLHNNLTALVGVDAAAGGYVMSNSVYMDKAGNMVDAVPLTAANIKTSATEATDNPINIYVERIAAKVKLTASGKVDGTTNIFDTDKNSSAIGSTPLTSLNNVDVYVKLNGWELYNDYTTSYLLKNIDKWDDATLGLTWNDIPYYRCYWAQSQPQDTDYSDSFSWSYGEGENINYGVAVGEHTYCGENTNQAVMTDGKITSDPRTKVILKGQLMQKNGENYEPLELAKWYGTEYAGNEALRIAVANSLMYTLYYPDPANNGKYISIAPEDIKCVEGAVVGAQAYEVGFQLSNTGAPKTWYKYDSTNGYVAFDLANNTTETNNYLKSVEPALLYAAGQTYYIVDIKHLGKAGSTAEYGIVRNHVYQIDIKSIKGYGSPVYVGNSNIENPEYPTVDEASYVSAKINILSWKIVQQSVDIVQ